MRENNNPLNKIMTKRNLSLTTAIGFITLFGIIAE